MDPDQALEDIRHLTRQGVGMDIDDLQKLIDLIEGLDSWLCRSGFLPRDWQPPRRHHTLTV